VIRGRGSAIFWHLARPGFTPTAGCVAVEGHVFAKVLPRLARHCRIVVR
jgi:L,D-peptidoglycan transpeptidase YkuD (ErfK/YbiS/YcfS/YnhG family)